MSAAFKLNSGWIRQVYASCVLRSSSAVWEFKEARVKFRSLSQETRHSPSWNA